MMLFLLAQIIFPPPAKKPGPAAPAAGEPADDKGQPAGDAVARAEAGKAPPDQADPVAAAAGQGAVPEVAAVGEPTQYFAFGSLDPATGYRMLVTVSNVGASVRRAELTSRRYLDQHDWSGYLGELELADADGGAKVQVVGPGTPAAAAGIKPGDVIVGIKGSDEKTISTVDEFNAALARTRPGQEIGLQVRRGEEAPLGRTVKLVRRPFAVLRPEIDNYRMRNAVPPAGFTDIPSFLLSLNVLNGKPLDDAGRKRLANVLEGGNWEVVSHDEKSVTFRRVLAELNLEVVKRYTLEPVPADKRADTTYPGYNVQLDVELRNTSGEPQKGLAYQLQGPTGMPIEGWWFAHKISQTWSAAGLRDVVVRFAGGQNVQIGAPTITKAPVDPMGQGKSLAYAGVDGLYFSAVLVPIKPLAEVWFDTTEAIFVGAKPDARTPTFTNVTCVLTRQPIELAAGASHTDSYQVFIGPKRPALMAQYLAGGDPNYSLDGVIYFGWPIFAAVARIMLAILHFFYGFVGNYGIAIILLTVLVRGALFPISYKQTQSMARMQALKPEMDRLGEKYKDDMQKKSQAIQELYRKNKINPLGGCLPVFLQMPIFIGLYRALAVDIELRLSPLFSETIQWCSNLAAPDMLWNWSAFMPDSVNNGQGMFMLGPYLNVLPLVTVLLFLVTQKMAMPAPTNEQAVLQQKMMKYMTLFMGVLFYKVAAGLCLYFIASSLWGIGERKLLPKAQPLGGNASGGASGPAPGASGKRPDGAPRPDQNGSPGSKRSPKAKKKK
ncbi:MAG: YidC/Oxa1 family insertase periplasmic-domain containing protein [Pirellulales bacterium]